MCSPYILSVNKFAVQARASKQQNMTWKQKNMAQNLFPNECNAIIQFVDFKGALSGQRQFLANGSPLKRTKNALYLILKALFVLKIFKFLS